ncbi:hypothetical protein [Streptomyces nymphaeiformis]|uniref:Uncharacterized protein n=1 Tax=Streptomyces nymphaeiformis TaxID=2663842 RepID=A0A7W7U4Q1_9ACTN|nr:hypothetical protein [Streptomyces nymphaeiformis]MBB4984985.1 hypothetical protein [Streptomyces nymphaeiformis]
MTTIQEPLWHDGWEQEADAKVSSTYWAGEVPADYSRSCSRRDIPIRTVVDVIRSL